MPDRKKVINEIQFQLNSKEVKEQHYPVQLSVSDAEKILALLKEQRQKITPIHAEHKFFGTNHVCGSCGKYIFPAAKYCNECGRDVEWDD